MKKKRCLGKVTKMTKENGTVDTSPNDELFAPDFRLRHRKPTSKCNVHQTPLFIFVNGVRYEQYRSNACQATVANRVR